MSLYNRTPGYPRASDVPLKKVMTQFIGMLTGEPASELPDGYSALNYNVIDKGEYYEVRNGSRKYTSFKIGYKVSTVSVDSDEITTENIHPWETGDAIYFIGDSLPSPFAEDTAYYVIKTAGNKLKLALTYSDAILGTNINITSTGSGTIYLYYGEINGYLDHVGKEKAIFMFGKSVYVANKRLNQFSKVLNMHGEDPDGVSTIIEYDNEAIILSKNGGIFKVYLEDDFYYMDKINKPVPTVLISDVIESLPATKYGYLYIYSMCNLDGTGNRNRLDSQILFESGTCQNENIKDYGEVYFTSEIGISTAVTHSIGTMTLPDEVNNITHFPLYRTRQIGENSGGVSTSVDSIGNRRDLMVWVADVPVAKAFVVNTSVAGTASIVSGNKYVLGDVSCTIKDTSGNSSAINSFTNENSVQIGAGISSGAAIYCAIGGGRVMKVSQSGKVITRSLGATFIPGDVGLKIFVSDGTYRHITKYLTANTVEVAETGDFTNYAATLKPLTGNFSRKWNDTIPDNPQGNGGLSYEDMYTFVNEGSDMYVPRRLALPMPDCDCGAIENGFLVGAVRGESKYYYSQIGDKPYCMGYYNSPTQMKKITGAISILVVFPAKIIILAYNKTYSLTLSSSTNAGRSAVGEVISELPSVETIDTQRGVRAWQTVRFKNQNYLFALTNDSTYRYFDGNTWSTADLSIINGRDAVSKKYLKLADQSSGIMAFYSNFGGMKLWFQRWTEKKLSSTSVYRAIQYTLNSTDKNIQCSLTPIKDRPSGINDIEMIIL